MSAHPETPAPLRIVGAFFQALNDAGIRYCHWKSTRGLAKAMSGRTDLDILVDRGQSRRFKEILYGHDFKPLVSDPSRQFPAIEDYLGFDRETGRLVHLHIHYRLILGEQYVKNYYLPLEQSFLGRTRVRSGVKVPDPELELIVLVLRALLKYRYQDAIRDLLGLGSTGGLAPATLEEIAYLLDQTSPAAVEQALRTHVPFISPELIMGFLGIVHTKPRTARALYRQRAAARRALRPYRRHGWLRARAIYLRGMLTRQWPFDRVVRRFTPGLDKRKIPVSGGLTVAFVGADGAGKSTIIRHVSKWLAWRLDVRTYYMGSSRPSLATQTLKRAADLTRLFASGCRRMFGPQSSPARLADTPHRWLKSARFLAEGRDRYRRYLESRRRAAQGAVIIYDRYPLEGLRIADRAVDGPRIASACNGHMGLAEYKLARIEEGIYKKILPAEHVFVLHVSPDISQTRKPEHKRELIEAKSQAIEQIRREGLNITDIDADQSLDQVLLQIKSALWHLL